MGNRFGKIVSYCLNCDSFKKDFGVLAKGSIQCMTFTPDSKTLLFGDSNGVLRAWDIESKKLLTDGKIHENAISDLKLSESGKFLFTSSYDKSVKLLNIVDEDLIQDLKEIHEGTIHSIQLIY